MRRWLTIVALLAAPAVAQTNNPNAELHGRTPGKPAQCIDLDRVGSAIIYNPTAVLYRQSGARIWRMTSAENCPSLRYFAKLSYRNTGRRLCVGDRFDVAPPGSAIASGHCRIGTLVPSDKAPK
jgi:hypothetical protein